MKLILILDIYQAFNLMVVVEIEIERVKWGCKQKKCIFKNMLLYISKKYLFQLPNETKLERERERKEKFVSFFENINNLKSPYYLSISLHCLI